ncbi:tyrosine-type recombinase/integrase [Paraburkholderia nemoris]|uniref:tyrosine-type recombinase/integrase n=1 Tax=Paraburkholderia nemoris TaxID=2793076 RepID=UPI001B18B6E4|nr:integrase arm-type DNA-binding domain-containing protein [Paraburkholderia nemoris]CAE6692379.1 Prophage integrase IntS [Paraburkholderia nemoris]
MPLSDAEIRRSVPRDKTYKLADGGGMYLEVRPNGSRYWRLKYRHSGKEKLLALGVYPTVTLKDAREKREAAKKKLANGVDPGEARKAEKRSAATNAENSFEAVAREWHTKFTVDQSESHAKRNLRRLEVHVFPYIGGRAISLIEPPETLEVLQRIEKKGTIETAHRVRSLIGQVMRYAIATGRAQRDVSADLRGAIRPASTKHHAAVTTADRIGELLRAIYGYTGTAVVTAALKLAPVVFQRPGEIRHAEWVEFDFACKMWTIPPGRMKRRKEGKVNGAAHLVPLSTQAVEILQDIQLLTGRGRYVFPSARGNKRPMSDMALSAAFKRMGIDAETAVPHGWRATARTVAVEVLKMPAEIVEMQLAHEVRDSLGRAYNRTQWLDERRDLMQRWADYLDTVRATP